MNTVRLENSLILFRLDDQLHAVPVSKVNRIFRIVEITPAPRSHPFLMGFVDVQGAVIPVVNTRALFGIGTREIELSDQLILVYGPRGLAALWVDGGTDIISLNENNRPVASPSLSESGVVQTEVGLVFIHDLDKSLQFLEESETNDAKFPVMQIQ